ncbi:hypothetical protein BOX15_Mlig002991g2, partial [Macrostomum lignano]
SNAVSPDDWQGRWERGATGFHQEEVTGSLVEFWSYAVSQLPEDKRDAVSVLVPLCGASRDLAWLLARPEVSSVCGIEISELALQRLLSENPQLGDDPSRRRSVGPGVECWESSDGRLKFYLGDLFSDSLLTELKSSCQLVWDRAALVAIDVPDRAKYVSRVRELCEAKHAWLMELADYDRSKYAGPPHAITEECTRSLFSGQYRVEFLGSTECPSRAERFKVPVFNQPVYFMSDL